MAYPTEVKIDLFCSEFSSAASGRDPLAILNNSMVIYSKMVMDITNILKQLATIWA
jgi:hypothetical protein